MLFFKLYYRAVLPPPSQPTSLNPQNRLTTIFVYKDALNSWSPASSSQGPSLQMWWGIKPGALCVLGKHWTTELHPQTNACTFALAAHPVHFLMFKLHSVHFITENK